MRAGAVRELLLLPGLRRHARWGTCKHIEAMLLRLRQRHRKALEAAAYKRTRASLSLEYGDTIEVRLQLPASPSPGLRSLVAEYFDPAGLLPRGH